MRENLVLLTHTLWRAAKSACVIANAHRLLVSMPFPPTRPQVAVLFAVVRNRKRFLLSLCVGGDGTPALDSSYHRRLAESRQYRRRRLGPGALPSYASTRPVPKLSSVHRAAAVPPPPPYPRELLPTPTHSSATSGGPLRDASRPSRAERRHSWCHGVSLGRDPSGVSLA